MPQTNTFQSAYDRVARFCTGTQSTILENENAFHGNAGLCAMIAHAQKEVYIYTDTPGKYLKGSLLTSLETAHANGAGIHFISCCENEPSAWLAGAAWDRLQAIADVRNTMPPAMQAVEIAIADDIIRFASMETGFSDQLPRYATISREPDKLKSGLDYIHKELGARKITTAQRIVPTSHHQKQR